MSACYGKAMVSGRGLGRVTVAAAIVAERVDALAIVFVAGRGGPGDEP
jgi:hypothetical protein